MRQSMFDNLDVVGMLASTWDLIIGKKEPEQIISEPEQEKEAEFYLKEHPVKKFNYRPQNLDEYIGQENAKELTKLNLQKIMNTKPVHFVISGYKGAGKSSLAFIIAKTLGYKLHYFIASTFRKENLKDFLLANEKDNIPHIIFIDEGHSLSIELGEFLYPLLEDFLLPGENVEVKPFIFITATTEKSIMLKKFAPLIDRCGADIVLEKYRPQDIKEIIRQYSFQVYGEVPPEEVLDLISVNARLTPRISINLTDDWFACKDIAKVLRCHRIIKNSLTDIDIKILRALVDINKPLGEENLSIIAGLEKPDYKSWVEPFLITEGYIVRLSKGRISTERAKNILLEIKNN